MKKRSIPLFTTIALLIASQYALASSNQQSSSNRQGPPQEAFTACEGKSAGDSASFEGRNGDTIEGTCEEMNGQMILRPTNPPQGQGQNNQDSSNSNQDSQSSSGQRQGPPPEAFTACEGKSAGDSASFEGRNGDTVEGTCEEMNGQMILKPSNPMR
jgi:hypothetical protein